MTCFEFEGKISAAKIMHSMFMDIFFLVLYFILFFKKSCFMLFETVP